MSRSPFLEKISSSAPHGIGVACANNSNCMYVGIYGYNSLPDNEGKKFYHELWIYNFSLNIWQQEVTEGLPPIGFGTNLKLWNSQLYIYGGNKEFCSTLFIPRLWICDLNQSKGNFTWKTVEPDKLTHNCNPVAGLGQGLASYKGYLYVFGGLSFKLAFKDLHRIKLPDDGFPKWEKIDFEKNEYSPNKCYRMQLAVDVQREW